VTTRERDSMKKLTGKRGSRLHDAKAGTEMCEREIEGGRELNNAEHCVESEGERKQKKAQRQIKKNPHMELSSQGDESSELNGLPNTRDSWRNKKTQRLDRDAKTKNPEQYREKPGEAGLRSTKESETWKQNQTQTRKSTPNEEK